MRAVLAETTLPVLPDPASTVPGEELVAYLLLLLLAAVIVLGSVCLVLVLHFVNQRRRELALGGAHGNDAARPAPSSERVGLLDDDSSAPWRPAGVLLVPARWMAVRAHGVREVREALGLSNATPCSLEDGLAGNHQQAIFLAPPVNGWILISGPGIPDPAEDIDEVYHLLRHLSIKLGSAQYFGFNRALGHHGWAWARGGGIVRAFAWAGNTVWNEGDITPAERALRVRCPGYTDPAPQSNLARDTLLSNLEKVPLLAARWSVDPVSVHQQIPQAVGVAGEFTRVRSS